MTIIISKLIWDDWNSQHIAKHKVTIEEVEISLADVYSVYMRSYDNRILSLGRSGKRLITTVLQPQEKAHHYYVVTARDMAKKERMIYRRHKELLGDSNEKKS